MPTTTGFLPRTDERSAGEERGGGQSEDVVLEWDGARLEVLADGTVVAVRSRAASPQLYVSATADGVAWGTDLADLVGLLRERDERPEPHAGTVLAYLRGDDVASAPTTFYEGILRVRVGDEVRIAPDGAVSRERPGHTPVGRGSSLAAALTEALGADATGEGAEERARIAILGEDLASAAVVRVAAPREAVRVRAGSVRAQDASAETGGSSRARAALEAAGAQQLAVHPTTDRFKRDLDDLLRTQAEPFGGLGVYAHYCACREIAAHHPGARVVDATGPVGAGLISSSNTRPVVEGARGLVAGMRERLHIGGREVLQADAVLRGAFVARTPATGHLPAARGSARDTAAQVAAERNADRFGLRLELPLLEPSVSSALAIAVQHGTEAPGVPARSQGRGLSGLAARARDALPRRREESDASLQPFAALAAPEAARTAPDRMAAIDQGEWLSRLKGTLYEVFRSAEFAGRPWVDQRAVLEAFEAHVAGRTIGGEDLFWRLFCLELWMRACIDARPPREDGAGASALLEGEQGGGEAASDHGQYDDPDPKAPLAPNPGKVLDLEVTDAAGRVTARRYPVQTGKFSATSDMDAEVARYVGGFFAALDAQLAAGGPDAEDHRAATVGRLWNLTISEKIIAIMQGRSYFVWDVHPTRAARTLSRYVSRTPAGIGLGDPVTMELAIREAGLPRVVVAAAAGAVGRAIGRRGLFYEVVGGNVRAIDGPTEYSVYPANVSAKLPPKDPDKVAEHLNGVVRACVPEAWRATFTGTVVMDANDIGRNTLGKAAPGSAEHYEAQFADNPLGQGREQTPMAIVFER